MALDELKEAIAAQMPISFTYHKPGKDPGLRYGNPHAVFVMTKKDGSKSTKVHIVQVGGVSDSGQPFPSFRLFDLESLEDVKVDAAQGQFELSDKYKPASDMYDSVICKV